LQLS
jgi:predicted ATPase